MFNHTEWQRKRRRENPERDREYSRQYYWRHKDDPEWREKRRAYLKKYCLLHKEACHANSRKWRGMAVFVQRMRASRETWGTIFSPIRGARTAKRTPAMRPCAVCTECWGRWGATRSSSSGRM